MDKVFMGVTAFLLILVCWLYIGKTSSDRENLKLTNRVSEMANQNAILSQQVEGYKNQIKAYEEATKVREDNLEKQRRTEKDTLSLVEKIINNKEEAEHGKGIDDAIPSDLVRVLSDHCNKVRGQACNNP